jgi:hypothetical protein
VNKAEEMDDKIITNEIEYLRNALKVLIMAYWKRENFEIRYNRKISNVEWERFLAYMKPKGHKLNDLIYGISDQYFNAKT